MMQARNIRQLATRIIADVHLGRDANLRNVTVHVDLPLGRSEDVHHQRVLVALDEVAEALAVGARRSVDEAIAIERQRRSETLAKSA